METTGQKSIDRLPRACGSYVLVLRMPVCAAIRVGRLGSIEFEFGWYAYAGSAFGPGGLAGRIGHHLKAVRRPHWHIDYLRSVAEVMEVWAAVGTTSREHAWAAAMADAHLAGMAVPGFGCSDCRCNSHLVFFKQWPDRDLLMNRLGAEPVWFRQAPTAAGPQ